MNKKLIAHLRGLSDGSIRPKYKGCGLCQELYLLREEGVISSIDRGQVKRLTYKWPEFSGERRFPVSHPTKTPEEAYTTTRNLWSLWTTYGRARRRMCAWLADELEKGE